MLRQNRLGPVVITMIGSLALFFGCEDPQENQAPVAVPGPLIMAEVGEMVQLDGSGSSDPENDPLAYHWTIDTAPERSAAVLSDSSAEAPTMVPDKAGTYVIQLIVSDGEYDSDPATIDVIVEETNIYGDHPSFSPDGTKIVFSSLYYSAPYQNIYLINSDGSGLHALTSDTVFNTTPAWSPDGAQIAFASNKSGNYEINIMNSDGSSVTNITSTPNTDELYPSWSPDGEQLAFNSDEDLATINVDGTNITYQTSAGGVGTSWNPVGGSTILYVTGFMINERVTDDIFVISYAGFNPVNLTTSFGWDSYPSWSPDATQIIYSSAMILGESDIYVMNADGSGRVTLTNTKVDSSPRWSPDGSQIIFVSSSVPPHRILVIMDADGSNPTPLMLVL